MRLMRILPVLALAACASNPAPDTTASTCPGQRMVVVNNDWNQAIDVYASTGAVIGSVRPREREEFVLPENARFAYARASSRQQPQRVPRQFVRFRYLCQ
jgi:hypothetical protein